MKKRVLVLGAYGLIGAEIIRRLRLHGHEVVGLVRSRKLAARLLPGVTCHVADIAQLQATEHWSPFLEGVDVVVNASGALQTGLRDDLSKLQHTSINTLIDACGKNEADLFIQISAPGAAEGATTEFLRSKAQADEALRISQLQWVIFKPGLVIGSTAYGGTALIRMLAGFPLITPIVMPQVRIQTISVEDVAEAVCETIDGRIGANADYDLVEDSSHSLVDIVRGFRRWMGFPDAPVLHLPKWLGAFVASLADAAGWLGWRSPLRSTALKVLEDDVIGDAAPWRVASGKSIASFEDTLSAMPASLQERVFAKAQLLIPIIVLVLSAFFIVSGIIGVMQVDAAAAILEDRVDAGLARMLVYLGAACDVLLGAAILFRSCTKIAAGCMIGLSAAYLVSGSMMTPHLWLDPIGPFVKVFPAMCLALCAILLIEER